MSFESRTEAGKLLKNKLSESDLAVDTIAVIPKGGIIVGEQLKKHYNASMNTITVSDLKNPKNTNQSIGSVANDGTIWLETQKVESLDLDKDLIEKSIIAGTNNARKQHNRYEISKKSDYSGKHVMLVDDYVKNRSKLLAAIGFLLKSNVRQISVAVPVTSQYVIDSVNELVDFSLVLKQYRYLDSVSTYYTTTEQFPGKD